MVSPSLVLVVVDALLGLVVGIARIGGHTIVVVRRSKFLVKVVLLGRILRSHLVLSLRQGCGRVRLCVRRRVVVGLMT